MISSIAYFAELRCYGCGALYARGAPYRDHSELPAAAEQLATTAIQAARWIRDGQAMFCPSCQITRRSTAEPAPTFSDAMQSDAQKIADEFNETMERLKTFRQVLTSTMLRDDEPG